MLDILGTSAQFNIEMLENSRHDSQGKKVQGQRK